MDRPRSVAELRSTVTEFARIQLPGCERWCVALSGGADSLALTAVAAELLPTVALIVDHGLQADSAAVAETARRQAMDLGCVAAHVLPVCVGTEGGLEAAARSARYAALDAARAGAPVLIGHTLDDQAETVLLGLGRGSGPRSIAGMRSYQPPWGRPLLGVRRAATETVCAELGLVPWRDPHNSDLAFTRARLRHEVLPLLEQVLGGGVAEALARTADLLQLDGELLDALATDALRSARVADGGSTGLDVAALQPLAPAVRLRVLRLWLLAAGARGLTYQQLRAVDALVTRWRGQGGVAVGTARTATPTGHRRFAERRAGQLRLRDEPI